MTYVNSRPLTLATVEKLTGLSREVLRKWELRYQFPQPLRGKRGERLFSSEDVVRLQMQASLIAAGQRAGSVVPLDAAQLQVRLAARALTRAAAPTPEVLAQQVQNLLQMLAPNGPVNELAQWLEAMIERNGLAQFVAHTMPALNWAVGDAWQTGHIGIHAEHRYTETLRKAVTCALPPSRRTDALPTVLLTTPPGELHSLGLLGLYAQLRLLGADAISLGTQTPMSEVLSAAYRYDAAVVAISISACLNPAMAGHYLQILRSDLPTRRALWVGGAGCAALAADALAGCEVFADTPSAMLRWQQLNLACVAEKTSQIGL